MLEPDGVRRGEDDVGADDDRQLPAGEEPDPDPAHESTTPTTWARRDRHLAGRDRAEALLRVQAVGLDVERVVQEVRAACREAERDERDARCRGSRRARRARPPRPGPATTSTFLTHCFGRASARSAVSSDRGTRSGAGPPVRAATGTWGISAASAMRRGSFRAKETRQCYCLRVGPGPVTGPKPTVPRRSGRRVRLLARLGCGPAEDALRHGRRLGVDASLVHVGPGAVHRRVVGCGERGELGEMTREPEVALAASATARAASRSAPPASAASSPASAASGAGLRCAGLPSYQPPKRRQTLRTTNSGSS